MTEKKCPKCGAETRESLTQKNIGGRVLCARWVFCTLCDWDKFETEEE